MTPSPGVCSHGPNGTFDARGTSESLSCRVCCDLCRRVDEDHQERVGLSSCFGGIVQEGRRSVKSDLLTSFTGCFRSPQVAMLTQQDPVVVVFCFFFWHFKSLLTWMNACTSLGLRIPVVLLFVALKEAKTHHLLWSRRDFVQGSLQICAAIFRLYPSSSSSSSSSPLGAPVLSVPLCHLAN